MLSLLLLLLIAGLCAGARADSQPRLDAPEVVMDTTKRDFGEVFAGEELEQIFLVRNAGTKPLELSQKSTLTTGSAAQPRPAVASALARSQYLIRAVAARRAAPS